MPTLNVQSVDKYPENYDNISSEQQAIICAYMNGMQALANRYYEKYMTHHKEEYFNLYNHTMSSLTGSKNAYATLNIMVEYSWPNHNLEWFLATKTDAENYANADEETTTITDTINQLLSYGEVGI